MGVALGVILTLLIGYIFWGIIELSTETPSLLSTFAKFLVIVLTFTALVCLFMLPNL